MEYLIAAGIITFAIILYSFWQDSHFWEERYAVKERDLVEEKRRRDVLAKDYRELHAEYLSLSAEKEGLKKRLESLQEMAKELATGKQDSEEYLSKRVSELMEKLESAQTSHDLFLGAYETMEEDYNKAKSLIANLLSKKKVVKNGKSIKRKKA